MKKLVLAVALFALAAPAFADTYRFDMQVVSTGDSTGKLMSAGGKPDQVNINENEYGARTGENWVYYRDGKTITFTVDTNGRVTRITEVR